MADRKIARANLTRRSLLELAALAPALAPLAAAAADAALPGELLEAVGAYDRATVGNDVDALAELVADDYLLVNSDSSLQDKASYLEDFRVPGFKLDPYEIEEPLARAWGDAALTGGLLTLSWTLDGKRESRRLRIAHVWTRRDGRWRIAYTQLTRVPEPA
jgi:ketosteroid isomerase-like protein